VLNFSHAIDNQWRGGGNVPVVRNLKLFLLTIIALSGSKHALAEIALVYPGEKLIFETEMPSTAKLDFTSIYPAAGIQTMPAWSTENDGTTVVTNGKRVEITMPQSCPHHDGIIHVDYYNPELNVYSILSFRILEQEFSLEDYDYGYLDSMPMSGDQFKLNFVSRSNLTTKQLTTIKTKGTPVKKPVARYPRLPGQFPDKVQIGPWDKRWDNSKVGPQYVVPQNGDSVFLGNPDEQDGDYWLPGPIQNLPPTNGNSTINHDGTVNIGGEKIGIGGGYATGTTVSYSMYVVQVKEFFYQDVYVWKNGKWTYSHTVKNLRLVHRQVITIILPDGTSRTVVNVVVVIPQYTEKLPR
jgi:hypothetical protein